MRRLQVEEPGSHDFDPPAVDSLRDFFLFREIYHEYITNSKFAPENGWLEYYNIVPFLGPGTHFQVRDVFLFGFLQTFFIP